ncbi:MAG: thioredoxin family protein [Gemmatimonadaceae bacterium]
MTDRQFDDRISPERFASATTLDAFIERATRNQDFWRGVHRAARVSPELLARARAIPARWHMLALSEDWCGDAVNTLPVIARLVEVAPQLELRVLGRDLNPDLMDAHLTRGTRSIPAVMVYDAGFTERGWWGPRPTPLQQWFDETGRTWDKVERGRYLRDWYARDRGATTATEIVTLLEDVSGASSSRGDSSDPDPRG